ncbi:M48 family metallopeptidase [Ammoniphilus sp. CFH 90114]|uniref:M48 family metallopeptidase n=1 Tax=Ammoniphilus sp. CFH 90114 TaxID=2493665 RepID=UPI00100EFF1C|nr:M48 family metallopeptidase [Ammoniphilus sp. CFH 90114]RXT04802.1 M48 family peptidase [Ammoniphilus sp. CFH 90114]
MRKFYILYTTLLAIYGLLIAWYLLYTPSSLPPDSIGGPSDPATFMNSYQMEQSVSYSRIRNMMFFIGGPLEWGFYLLILGSGLASVYQRWVGKVKGSFFQVVLFVFILTLTTSLLHFPQDYFTFQLRHEYGMTNEPFASWGLDKLKAFALSVIMSSPIIWLLYWLIRKSPRRWWLWCWTASIPIALFFMYIQPVVLDPVFNKFSPLKDQQLKEEILFLADRANVPVEQVYEVDMSKKTNALNAYVNGIGNNTRIVLWDTTLDKLEKDEILFIMAHEIGHYVLNHMIWLFVGTVFMILAALFVIFYLLEWTVRRFGQAWGIPRVGDISSLPIILLLISVLSFLSMPVQNAVSRQYERAADIYAMEMMQDSDAAVRTFQRLAVEGKSEVNPPPLVKYFLYGHPTLHERILFVKDYGQAK